MFPGRYGRRNVVNRVLLSNPFLVVGLLVQILDVDAVLWALVWVCVLWGCG